MVQELSSKDRSHLKRQLEDTLQGRIYSAIDKRTGEWVVVKTTWKELVKLGKLRNGYKVHENIIQENKILRYLLSKKDKHKEFPRLIYKNDNKMLYTKLKSIKQQRKSQRKRGKFLPKYLNVKRYHKKYQYNRW